jgi:hypothetical protein
MTSNPNELIRDPLFQLNALLWLVQPLPSGTEITPLFYKKGFEVYSIALQLGPPLDVILLAQESNIAIQERLRPDIILVDKTSKKYAFIECKKSSFGPASDTSEQARTLLIISGIRAGEVLGLAAEKKINAIPLFALPEDERSSLVHTLDMLFRELKEKRIPAAKPSTLGLCLIDDNLCIVIDKLGSRMFGVPVGNNAFMKCEADTDPRPLYFIPYDPDVGSSEEQAFCRRVLFERMHSTVISAIGRADPPVDILIESSKLLNDAMLGMYGHWGNQDSSRHMRRLCRDFMKALVEAANAQVLNSMLFCPEAGWKVSLPDHIHQEKLIDTLSRFSSETLTLPSEPLPSLLDDL